MSVVAGIGDVKSAPGPVEHYRSRIEALVEVLERDPPREVEVAVALTVDAAAVNPAAG